MKKSENILKIPSQKISEKIWKIWKFRKFSKISKKSEILKISKNIDFVKGISENFQKSQKIPKNFPSEKNENIFRKFSKFLNIFFDNIFTKSCAWSGRFILANKTLRAGKFIFNDFFHVKKYRKVVPGSEFGL